MDEQLLKDFIATAEKYNYDWNTILPKFPELKGYDPQLLKDYAATAKKDNYNYATVNAKFPEFNATAAQAPPAPVTAATPAINSMTGQPYTANRPVEKKKPLATTASPSAGTSSALPKPKEDNNFRNIYGDIEKNTVANKAINFINEYATVPIEKNLLGFADNLINASKNVLTATGFFDDNVPNTSTPITDAVKIQQQKQQERTADGQIKLKTAPLSPGGMIISKVINSQLPQETKTKLVNTLTHASEGMREAVKYIKENEEKYGDTNLVSDVTKGIVGMVPELAAAEAIGPKALQERVAGVLTKYGTKITKDALPWLQKAVPKAFGVIEDGVKSGFTKVLTAEGAVAGLAKDKTEDDSNTFWNGIKGAAEGLVNGIYMHGLGEAAGKAATPIAKFVSKTGAKSAISTAIATPLANAGVFATAKVLREGVLNQQIPTARDIAMEAGTGIGFSLLHLGSQYKNHNELNHYYGDVLRDDALNSFSRVINETKTNLDMAYDPNLTPERVKELQDARDEIKKAIIKEPDLKNKQLLGNEAIKIQNQLDAHHTIDGIVENKDFLIEKINSDDKLTEQQRDFYTKKVAAIADAYDTSEFGTKKRELNAKIDAAQKDLEKSGNAFQSLTVPSDRIAAKIELEKKQQALDEYNKQLTELIATKTQENAVQEQATNAGVLRTKQPELGLQEVGQGNAQPEVAPTEEQAVTPTQPGQEVADPLKDVKSTMKAIEVLPKDTDGSHTGIPLSPLSTDAANEGTPYDRRSAKSISQAYHDDKAAGIESKLVQSVEGLLKPQAEAVASPKITRETINALTNDEVSNAYDEIPLNLMPMAEGVSPQDAVFEAYYKAKQSNTHPELVKAVEDAVSLKTQETNKTQDNGQPTTTAGAAPKPGPAAGNRLFNKPLAAAKTIADRYFKRVFGTDRQRFEGKRTIDEAKLKRLSDAFIAMEHNPNDPQVKAAYEALAKETIDQYQAFLDGGYTVEFKDKEPYANSQEMIDDLRNNRHISILSTEAEFGNEPITDKERAENPLLKDSGFKDANGKTMLINDVFRAIHDFFGHAELGNSFGPKGEENAWNVHARMYSPLARRAMTMETRAQNAFVNFSGINERIEGLREEARKLREQGDEEGAKKVVEQIYKEGKFGPQKVGLVPEEFSNIDEEKPHEQQLSELEQMFPQGQAAGENRGTAASDTKAMDEMHAQNKDERVRKVIRTAQRLTNTLKSLFPNAEIHLHDTQDSYSAAMGEVNGVNDSNGNFAFGTDANGKPFIRIDINTSTANAIDVAHEVAHAVLHKAFGDNQSLFRSFQEKIAKVLSTDSNQGLIDFANQEHYKQQGVTYEEYMAQLKALLSEQGTKIELSTAKKVATIINGFVSRITNGKFKPFQEVTDVKQVIDFVNKVTGAMAKGEAIDLSREASFINNSGINGELKVGDNIQARSSIITGEIKKLPEHENVKKEEGVKLSTFNGKRVNVMESDRMVAGVIEGENGKAKYKFLGGVGFPLVTGKWWASRELKTAESIAKNANANRDADGYIYSAPMVGSAEQHMSNADMLHSTIESIKHDVLNKKSSVTKDEMISYIDTAFNQKSIIGKRNIIKNALNKGNSIEKIFDELNYVLFQEGKTIVDKNGKEKQVKTIVDKNGKDIIGEDGKPIELLTFDERRDIVGGILGNAKVRGNKFPSVGSITDVAKRFEEPITSKANKIGDLVVIFRTKGELKARKSSNEDPYYHKSYPSEIVALDKDGKPAEIEYFVLDGAYSLRDVLPSLDQSSGKKFTWDEYFAKHGEKSERSAEAQYARTSKISFASGEIQSRSSLKSGQEVDKVVKEARASGYSERAIEEFLTKRGVEQTQIDKSLGKGEATTSVKVSEELLPGYDRMMSEAQGIIEKSNNKVDSSNERTLKNVMEYVKGSRVYETATDVQRDKLIRDVNKMFDKYQKSAPSAVKNDLTFGIGRIFSTVKDIAKVTMTEKAALTKQIKDMGKGAKDAVRAWRQSNEAISREINDMAASGRITASQAANVIKKFAKVNVLSETHVQKFTDYMAKVFADADYSNKLSNGRSLKSDISKLSRNTDKNANLRAVAAKFSKIEPSMVENIDEYNKYAAELKESIKGSSIRGTNVNFAQMVDIMKSSEYIDKTIEAQDKKIREQRIAEIQDLMGIDASDFSAQEMLDLLKEDATITKDNERIVRSTINKAFDMYSTMVREMVSTGKDLFTGEDVEYSKTQKDLIGRFMDMDLNKLEPKKALEAVDALTNFLQNKSTARLETVVSEYKGERNLEALIKRGVVARTLSKYTSEQIGRTLAENTTTLPTLFEKMFPGFERSGKVMDMMGISSVINKKAFAQNEANNIVDDYVSRFYEREANGDAFNTDYNNVERGMASFMMRTVIGTEEQVNKEFERRHDLVVQAIDDLKQGNDVEKKKAELYTQAYDKILKDSDNIDDIKSKTDKTNLEAIKHWQDEWESKYGQMSDVSENVYNTMLEKDANYTPDRLSKLSSDTGKLELDNKDSAFNFNNGSIIKKRAGSLNEVTRPGTEEIKKSKRYVDLSFDKNMANSMYDVLVDINTAAPIRQVQAFMNSDNFKKLVPQSEDAKVLKQRIDLYVSNIRGKSKFSNDEFSKGMRNLNRLSTIGVGQALGGIGQPIKQVIPVAMNTLINAGKLDLGATFNVDKLAFINNSGMGIANRGRQSQADLDSLNKLIEVAATSKGNKAVKAIEKANEFMLRNFLEKPDVYIAKASWLTYYEKSLQKQGIDTKGLDYKSHELNEEAANYAQRMVDRQQNISDHDLGGKFFTSKEAPTQVMMKMLMPFASFRMNQASRFGADLITLQDKTSSKEDKITAARSLAGFGVELATFKIVSAGISILLGTVAKKLMGKDESDDAYKKRVSGVWKAQRTGALTDLISPLPVADLFIQGAAAPLLQLIEDKTGAPTSIYGMNKQETLKQLGTFGIAAERGLRLYDMAKLATTGKYTDDYGKEKKISEDDRKALKFVIPFQVMADIGVAPNEVNTIATNIVKDTKRKIETKAEQAIREEKAKKAIETNKIKTDVLDKIAATSSDQAVVNAAKKKAYELNATDEEKKAIKEENKAEREEKKKLLLDPVTDEQYDTEAEMEKYNKPVWEQRFGKNSDWHRSHEAENKMQKLLESEMERIDNLKHGYTKPSRRGSSSSYKFGPQESGSGYKFGPQDRGSKKSGYKFGPQD